jgi:hypothetical protein
VPEIARYLIEIRPQLKLLPNSIDIEADDLLEAKKVNRELLLRRQLSNPAPSIPVPTVHFVSPGNKPLPKELFNPMKNALHLEDLFKSEIIEALGLSLSAAASLLKVRRATACLLKPVQKSGRDILSCHAATETDRIK